MTFVYLTLGLAAVFGVLWLIVRYFSTEDSAAAAPALAVDKILNGDRDGAVEEMRRWYENSDQDVVVGVALGNLLRRNGNTTTALRTHRSLAVRTDLTPLQEAMIQVELSADFLAANLLDQAETAIEQALELGEPDERTVYFGERIFVRLKKWDRAAALIQQYGKRGEMDTGPRLGLLRYAEGQELWRAEAYEAAFKLYKKAVGAHAGCLPAHVAQSRYHRHQNKPQKALRELQKNSRVFEDQPWLYLQEVGRIANALEDADVFYNEIHAHLEAQTEDWRSRLVLADFLTDQDRRDDAAQALLTCLQQAPGVLLLHKRFWQLAADHGQPGPLLGKYRHLIREDLVFDTAYVCNSCGHGWTERLWSCPSCHQVYTIEERAV